MHTEQLNEFFNTLESRLKADFGAGIPFTPKFPFKDPVHIGHVIIDDLWVEDVYATRIAKLESGKFYLDVYCENLQTNAVLNIKQMSYGEVRFDKESAAYVRLKKNLTGSEYEFPVFLNICYKNAITKELTQYAANGWLDECYLLQKEVEYMLRMLKYMQRHPSTAPPIQIDKDFKKHEDTLFKQDPSQEISFLRKQAFYSFLTNRNEYSYNKTVESLDERERIGADAWDAKQKKQSDWAMSVLDDILSSQ